MYKRQVGLAAVGVLVLAFVSPLCALSAALFSARVVHHILLVAVALFMLATLVLWGWHVPAAYDAAMANHAVYWVMQATLLGSAWLFWRAVLAPAQAVGSALLSILGTYMQMGFLGALLTFAPRGLYAIHATAPLDWGFTALSDQQLGGLIMWVPAGLPYAALGLLVARRGWRAMTVAHSA